MPQFFKLENQMDEHGQKFNPVEIAAMAHYLMTKSSNYDQLSPASGYKPNAQRGKEFFATKGCINCHSHESIEGLGEHFGPELSKVHAKIKAGKEGFDWLYTWVREPDRYHPRTKMPRQPLDAEKIGGVDVDPAADIAAFLLKLSGGPDDFKPTAEFAETNVDDGVLDELVRYFLGKVLTKTQIDKFMDTGAYPIPQNLIKGDEIELVNTQNGELNPVEWKDRKLSYLGRKTITRYGCYGCHDIPNFERSRPIGTALQDWGKKDRSRLAFEHIHEYLHHHGDSDLGVVVVPLDPASVQRLKVDAPSGVLVDKI
ncbi:MAG: c-type cytochrome, partial [Planctomycetes bacterium]|nr:c-type cytochrome [Planctomycetota bacterium]